MKNQKIHVLERDISLQNEIVRRKEAEKALKESEKRFRELVEETDVLIAKLDGRGRFTYVNHVGENIFGVGTEQCIGRSIFEFVHHQDRNAAKADFGEWIKNQLRNVNYEVRHINLSSGVIHHMLWAVNFLYNEAGELTGINSFARDLTDRKIVERELHKAHAELEQRENERTKDLLRANKQLKKEIEDRNRIEKALRESEERYRVLFENNPIETIIVDKKAMVTGYNLAEGQPESSLPNIGDIMYKDYAGRHKIDMLKELKLCIKSGIPKEFPEQQYYGRFLDIRIAPFPGGAIITSIDITKRKRAEKALRESEERYRALFENNPVETIIVNHDAKVTGYNLAKEMSGFRLPNIGDIMYKDFASKHEIDMHAELMECIKSGNPKEFAERKYDSRFLHIRISPFSGGAIITSIDISYSKRVEEALRESEKRYRKLVETISHGIQEINTEGSITFANSALHSIFGYENGELIGKSVFDLMVSEGESKEMRNFLETLVREQPARIPYLNKCMTKRGRIIDIQSDWNYKKDKEGNIIGFISIITDITKRLRAEEGQNRLEKQLHHVQKMEAIGTLAGGIAHDFNNILGSILLNAELAIDDLPKESQTVYSLQQIVQGSHRAKDFVRQILTFSRESEVERKPIKIYEIVKDTLRMLRAMLPATIVIQQEMSEETGTILADSTQIQQLVLNLSSNSAHAMKAEGGILKVELSDVYLDEHPADLKMYPGYYVKLAVSDMGCGISPEIRNRIFDPFFTTKRPGEGTGLGLSVVHGIVINHKGMITFDSKLGKGTTFIVHLPIIEGTASSSQKSTSVLAPMGNERILFVDDEEVVVDANKRILMRLGYDVTVSTDSRDALLIFRSKPEGFDLVITDMTMPNMTGAELARELIKIRQDIPIILCTGYSQLITPEKSNAIGIQEFVMKPFSRHEIAGAIRKVLDKNQP